MEKCSILLYQFGFWNKIGFVDALSVVDNVIIEAELIQEGLVLAAHDVRLFILFVEEKPNEEAAIPEPAVNRPAQVRAVGGRHNQARMRVSAARRRELEGSDEELSESEEEGPKVEIPEGVKVGKKKLAKLEAKAEKRKMREQNFYTSVCLEHFPFKEYVILNKSTSLAVLELKPGEIRRKRAVEFA
ncbi:hypothetical protein QYM36_018936 [Artemia franciscana]|uniref:Uncharacterized protein n=1 Tax=Artemia franciscana TaxID=6661 RepID=A0AA88H388_ARTSF|nr:hypothetical protein QYM36_018936 [Artemia franciscana]